MNCYKIQQIEHNLVSVVLSNLIKVLYINFMSIDKNSICIVLYNVTKMYTTKNDTN